MAKKKKTGYAALGIAALVGAGAWLLFGRNAKASADPSEVIEDVDPVEPGEPVPDGPPVEPAPPKTKPAGEPPPWSDNQIMNEVPASFSAVTEFRDGTLPVGKPARAKITDVVIRRLYPGAPKKIPKGWNAPGANILGWQMWVDTWTRIYNYVGDFLDQSQ